MRVTIQPDGKRLNAERGDILLDVLLKSGISNAANCGGQGRCGQCKVQIINGAKHFPTAAESDLISEENLAKGYRLACRYQVEEDTMIFISSENRNLHQRLQASEKRFFSPDGIITTVLVEPAVSKKKKGIAAFDYVVEQLFDISDQKSTIADLEVIKQLSILWRDQDRPLNALIRNGEIIGFTEVGLINAGLAVDIGSTKIAASLVNLTTGEFLGAKAAANPQIVYGEDIISRLSYAKRGGEFAGRLSSTVRETINSLAHELAKEAGIITTNISEVCLVGNTAIIHLLLNLQVDRLISAPYIGVLTREIDIKARDIDLHIAPGGYAHLPQGIGGFIGSDHTAMILASDLGDDSCIEIGIDIGTNTEILLNNRGKLISASCASGPAFEGAHIEHGMRAADGAIEKVEWNGHTCSVQTIGNCSPLGLCGAGVVELVFTLKKNGLINHRGHLQPIVQEVRKGRHGLEYVVVPASDSGSGSDIVITQKDITEIQLAKAAIHAGLTTLLEESKTSVETVEKVVLAGAFGTFLTIECAVGIGMIPAFHNAQYLKVGNAAADGAAALLVSKEQRERGQKLVDSIQYLQLESCSNFKRNLALATQFTEPKAIQNLKKVI